MPTARLRKLSPAAFALHEQGWSLRRIARQFGVSHVAVSAYLRRYHTAGNNLTRAWAVGPCEICGTTAPHHADQDHANGHARGLLCARCNQGLGLFKDSTKALRAAIRYLQRYQ